MTKIYIYLEADKWKLKEKEINCLTDHFGSLTSLY